MKRQADKASPAHVALHIRRQRALGERAVGEHDKPRPWEMAATAAVFLFIFVGSLKGWW